VDTVNDKQPPVVGLGGGVVIGLVSKWFDRTYYCNILPCPACVAQVDMSGDMFCLMLHLNAELVLCR